MNTTITKKSILLRTATMLGRRLVMTLLLTLMTVAAWADGAKTLPYSYSFENNDLAAEGWTTVDCDYDSGISEYFAHSGNYKFQFFLTSSAQYLISPKIESDGKDFKVSFYYQHLYTDNFIQVGYSTTTNELSEFSWEDVTLVWRDWALYEKELPANAKYVAIKSFISDGTFYLDEFSFAVSGCLPPENLTANDISDQSVMLTWTAPSTTKTITGYAYQYKKESESIWSAETTITGTSVIISGLSGNTSYDFRVQTLYEGGSESDHASITILTDCSGSVSLPFSEDFENGMGCWRVVNGDTWTGITNPYKKSKVFSFQGDSPQYLISPQLNCTEEILVVLYYSTSDLLMPMSFQVGYSFTTDAPSAFTWDDEVTSTTWDDVKYEHNFPADTKYIAVKYTSNSTQCLYIDNFSVSVKGALPPAQVSVSTTASESVTLTWDAVYGATNYAYQYKKVSESTWSDEVITTATSAAINGLMPDTDYKARVKAIFGSNASIYTATQFTTDTGLPYEMGFEDGYGRWTMVDCEVYPYYDANGGVSYSNYTGRKTNAAHDGNVGFQFCRIVNNPIPQYLISPRFAGNKPIMVSFYVRIPSNISETFCVGYSTTTNDIDAFTFDSPQTVSSSNWIKYEVIITSGIRYFTIKYTSNEYKMYLDDFCFEEYSDCAQPINFKLTYLDEKEASLTWDIIYGATYVYQYKKTSESTWSAETELDVNSVVLSGLTPNTYYNFRVKAKYGSYTSNYATFRFQTDANVVDLPYNDSFENGMGGWRMIECDGATEIVKPDSPHSGAYNFMFWSANHHQYLVSPHFAGGTPMKVSFYYQNYQNYPGIFMIGYASSKTDNAIWIDDYVAVSNGGWNLYEATIPATAQYVFICSRREGDMLYLDDFSFTPVSSITFAKEGFSTYYDSKYDLTLPAGVKAYIVTASEGAGSLTYQAIADGDGATNTVPKGTAVMLRTAASDAAQSIDIPLASPTAAAISETNLLHGSDTEITTTGGDAGAKYYKLSYGTDQTGNGGDDLTSVLGWFWGAADGAAFTSAAHKAWLVLPSTAGTRGFFGLPGDDETTLLRKVNSEEVNSEEWFSLDGRRLNGRPSAKGLYIHNGSKVAIK